MRFYLMYFSFTLSILSAFPTLVPFFFSPYFYIFISWLSSSIIWNKLHTYIQTHARKLIWWLALLLYWLHTRFSFSLCKNIYEKLSLFITNARSMLFPLNSMLLHKKFWLSPVKLSSARSFSHIRRLQIEKKNYFQLKSHSRSVSRARRNVF